ncbi:class I SAM-dependent methyltransferase [Streptomyces sp. M19]
MFTNATEQDEAAFARINDVLPEGFASGTAQEQADAAAEIYMPISAEAGRLLYNLVRATRPATVVEFGTSYGISTLHLAAAVRDNGTGRVVSTELSAHKAATARRTFAETGLDDLITVLEGDARETLAALEGPVDFILLDGWKDLCLPVLKLLEPASPRAPSSSPTTSSWTTWPLPRLRPRPGQRLPERDLPGRGRPGDQLPPLRQPVRPRTPRARRARCGSAHAPAAPAVSTAPARGRPDSVPPTPPHSNRVDDTPGLHEASLSDRRA